MALNFSVRTTIERKIAEIEKEYQQTQGLILTENDLKCLLYKKLMQITKLSKPIETQDQKIYANSIHTEVSWYDKNDKLTIKPDITILEPEYLSILSKYDKYKSIKLPLPNKEFSFYGKAILFELKFIRNKKGITPKIFNNPKNSIERDFKKIQELFERLKSQGGDNDVFCYFVIFNKTDIKCKEFEHFMGQNRHGHRYKVIYATGNVQINK